MIRKQANVRHLKLIGVFALALVLFAVAGTGSALADCQPGQMQEANLAYQNAVQALQAQQWDQAISRLNSIVGICPEHVDATRGLGDAFAGKGDYPNAIKWYQKVVVLRGDNVQAGDFANLGKAYAKIKKYKEARAEYMKAEKLAPNDCGVLFNLGVMHYAAGANPQSVEVLEHALEVCPDIREPILKQLSVSATAAAKQQRNLGNSEKATYYDNLMTKYGSAAGGSTTYDLATKKFEAKEYAEAITLLNKLVKEEPEKSAAWLTLARANDLNGNKGGCISAYEKYLELKPRDPKTYAAYVRVLTEAGQNAKAATKASEGVSSMSGLGRKKLAGIYYFWGEALANVEDYSGAKAKFQEAASSGNSTFATPATTQVGRMDDFMKMTEAQRKKALQGR